MSEYQNGDVIFDLRYKELFYFDEQWNGATVAREPLRFRLASSGECSMYPIQGNPAYESNLREKLEAITRLVNADMYDSVCIDTIREIINNVHPYPLDVAEEAIGKE